MIQRQFLLCVLLSIASGLITAQDVYKRNTAVDVQHYVFDLTLNDANNSILGQTWVTVDFKEKVNSFSLDLIGKSEEYGMEVTGVYEDGVMVNYVHSSNKIQIQPATKKLSRRTFRVEYQGIAQRGLVIDTTKFGQRSFFGDNWPNLARHWLPSVDHPYDKASVEFRIKAPDYYDVVATGKKIEESNLGNGYKLTAYHEPAPVAMKVVTIGVTKFATKLLGTIGEIPITAWVYPENRLDGFSDYALSVNVLDYFIKNIGPYAYAKLANMQAKTQWGGLENAGTISYFEDSVTGKNTVEGLIAHEIAHQWFGNSATENSWNHVWLSEGFATYFAILYQEHVHGDKKRKGELVLDRKQIIDYYHSNPAPIVDNTIKDPLKVLSVNSYQKGGWVLNMLRHRLGDAIFWKGIQAYYKSYENANVLTVDFKNVMEEVSKENLNDFFMQWVFTKGHPELQWDWTYTKGKVKISIAQIQEHASFNFPLEIGILKDGEMEIETVKINTRTKSFEIAMQNRPDTLILDPNVWLLFEEKQK